MSCSASHVAPPVGDTTPPVVTLSGSNSISTNLNTLFFDPGASWTDNIDGTGNIFG